MKKDIIYELITGLLVLMFLYTGFSKILDFKSFVVSMRFQHMPGWLTYPMIYILPASELIIAALMITDKTRINGIRAFLTLMIMFSLYVAAILLNVFPKAPCACGGVIKSLGWGPHFLLNLLFVGLAWLALQHYRRQRISLQHKKALKA